MRSPILVLTLLLASLPNAHAFVRYQVTDCDLGSHGKLKLVLVPRSMKEIDAADRARLEAEGARGLSDRSAGWTARLRKTDGGMMTTYHFVDDGRLKYLCPTGSIWMRRGLAPESAALGITWAGGSEGVLQPDGKVRCGKEVEFEIHEEEGQVARGKGACESKWLDTGGE